MEKLIIEKVKLTPKQQEIYDSCNLTDTLLDYIVVSTGRQVGKVLTNDTKVYRDNKQVNIDELMIGDMIQSGHKELTKVLDIFPHEDWDFYKITLHDGSVSYAGLEHLWSGFNRKKKPCVWTTEQIKTALEVKSNCNAKGEGVFYLPITTMEFDEVTLPIDPYILGLLLGDGYMTTTIGLCSEDMEILEDLGLSYTVSGTKFIPELYKYCSIEQRMELIRGLMDTDGYASHKSNEYCSKSKQMRDDLQWILKSCGIFAKAFTKHNKLYDRDYYYLRITTDLPIFKLQRKLDRMNMRGTKSFTLNSIKKIEFSHKADGRCIMVDHPTHTFVIDNNLLTHNSVCASQVALYWVLSKEDYNVGIFLPTYKQARTQFNRLKKGLKDAGKHIKFNKTEFNVEFPNGSFIKYHTAENDNCRGDTFQSIIVDEACFVKGDIFFEAILPTVAISVGQKRGKCLLLSTPKEKNWFYEYFMDDSPNYKSIKFTSYEGGLYTEDFLADVQRKTPDIIFRNEYMAEFMDGGTGLFEYKRELLTTYDINKTIDPKHRHVAAVDWGMENDYTVLTVINVNTGQLVFIQRWRRIDWTVLIGTIKDILQQYGNPLCYTEVNGIGNMPYKELRKIYPNAREWNTTNKNKTDAVMKLSADIKTGKLKIPYVDYLLNELDNYGFTFDNGIMKFAAKNGEHDDAVMSLAICNWYNKRSSVMM